MYLQHSSLRIQRRVIYCSLSLIKKHVNSLFIPVSRWNIFHIFIEHIGHNLQLDNKFHSYKNGYLAHPGSKNSTSLCAPSDSVFMCCWMKRALVQSLDLCEINATCQHEKFTNAESLVSWSCSCPAQALCNDLIVHCLLSYTDTPKGSTFMQFGGSFVLRYFAKVKKIK